MRILITEIVLLFCSISDIKTRTIDLRVIIGYFVIYSILFRDICVKGIMPGMLLLVLSFLFKDKIGEGDGLILMMIGIGESVISALIVIFMAFTTLIIYYLIASVVLMIYEGKLRRIIDSMPLVPFIFLGYNIRLLSNYK